MVQGILQLKDSWAAHFLQQELGDELPEFIAQLVTEYELAEGNAPEETEGQPYEAWRNFVTCLNDHLDQFHPLIGRKEEMERTIQILCRKDKNNPLHIGEPGVGKTALVHGLAARIEKAMSPTACRDAASMNSTWAVSLPAHSSEGNLKTAEGHHGGNPPGRKCHSLY